MQNYVVDWPSPFFLKSFGPNLNTVCKAREYTPTSFINFHTTMLGQVTMICKPRVLLEQRIRYQIKQFHKNVCGYNEKEAFAYDSNIHTKFVEVIIRAIEERYIYINKYEVSK